MSRLRVSSVIPLDPTSEASKSGTVKADCNTSQKPDVLSKSQTNSRIRLSWSPTFMSLPTIERYVVAMRKDTVAPSTCRGL